jgi:hypothetical protein
VHRLGPVLLCALAVHAVVWPSITPHEGESAYAHAYQPLIGTAGLAALALVAVLFARGLTREPRRPALHAGSLRLAGGAVGWIVLQETVEQSLAAGHPTAFVPSATTSGLLALAALAAAAALTAAGRAGSAIFRRLTQRPKGHGRRVRPVRPRPAAVCPLRPSVISLGLGRRGPPILV